MKLFQQMLVAPAALGLMAPVAATAAELNINEVSDYSAPSAEVQGISQFSDVYPTDWAYQALTNLAERHGCVAASPNGSMTRYEAAALLNKCLGNVAQVNEEEKRLINEFAAEIAVIKGRLDGLEAGMGEYEAGVFSTTTKLTGTTTFVIGAVEAEDNADDVGLQATVFNYDTKISLDSSFTGEDLLKNRIRSGNFGNVAPFATGDTALEVASATANDLEIDRSYYQFPVGDSFTATIGAVVRQDDMLGVWPSAYPSDSILDVLTYAGANDAYSLALGAGAGVTYSNDNLSASLLFISDESTDANQNSGGVWTEGGSDDITAQLAWVDDSYTVAVAYNTSDGGVADGTADNERFDAWGISGSISIDNDSSLVPSSINAGIGWKTPDTEDDDGADNIQDTADDIEDTTTWSFGFQWSDVGAEGNNLGIGVGTAEGHRDDSGYDDPLAWEIFYSMAVSDNITVTPALFVVEQNNDDDVTGGLVKTTFNF